ncbi:MAG: GNAT family N-acetyltransferase [Firmicutes bacterium]|nr:GNAT family N-acetyltransferase [Bacillota bacterium]
MDFSWLTNIISAMGVVNTVINFVIVVIFVYLLTIVIIFKFRSFIYNNLKDKGIGFVNSILITFRCRKNSRRAIRFFVEFAIIRCGGKKVGRKAWRNIQNSFFNDYDLMQESTYLIEVEDTSVLESDYIRDMIKTYFKMLSQPKYIKKFELTDNSHICFVSNIAFKSGFLLYTTFITGLEKIYRGDWQAVVNKYVQTFKRNSEVLDSSEVFSVFNWLTWAPGHEIKYDDHEYKILQYGLFDETNANCFILGNDEECRKLWEQMKEVKARNEMGFHASTVCKICETQSYFTHNSKYFGSAAQSTVDRLKNKSNEVFFVLNFQRDYLKAKTYLPSYMFGAYVWLMLYWGKPGKAFNVDKAVVFLADANYACKQNLDLHIDSIIHKTFAHLDTILKSEKFNHRKYHFVCAINDHVEARFKEEYNKRIATNEALAERLDITTKPYTINTIIKSCEDHFTANVLELDFTDIDVSVKGHMGLFCQFYGEQMIPAFPDPNERVTIEYLLRQIEDFKKNRGKDNYHIIIASSKGRVVGGALACYFAKTNSSLVEYLMVDEAYRNNHYGRKIMSHLEHVLERDAVAAGYKCLDFIGVELAKPSTLPELERQPAITHSKVWQKWYYRCVDVKYVQPANALGNEDVDYQIGIRIINENLKQIGTKDFISFIHDMYTGSMNVKVPEDCAHYHDIIRQLEGKEYIEFTDFEH